jgi:glycosyltransferase involved in cell wall biosynthesis
MTRELSYALVTPARDEVRNLPRLARSLAAQTLAPERWVIVDNGSTDGTAVLIEDLRQTFDWVHPIAVEGGAKPVRGAPSVQAFHAGLRELQDEPAVVVQLDADVSMEPDHFERLLGAFAADPKLGIASGTCLEQSPDGAWHPIHVTAGHVRGAVRAYRRECLQQVLPLEERIGWDGIDELKAAVLGWSTRMLPDLAFYHHRMLGARESGRTAVWRAQGEASYFMGYRPSYLLLRSLHHACRDPAALAMITSYVAAALRREPQYPDPDVRAHLRLRQSLRFLGSRAREARGLER